MPTLNDLIDSSYPAGVYNLRYGMPAIGQSESSGNYYLKFETTISGGELEGRPFTYVRSLSKKALFMIGRDLVAAGMPKTADYPAADVSDSEAASAWLEFVTPIFGGKTLAVDMSRKEQNGEMRNEIRIKGNPAFAGATQKSSPFG